MHGIQADEFDLAADSLRFWTRQKLQQAVERALGRRRFIVVSNREPYIHQFDGDELVCTRPVSGMITAVEPVVRACGGSWVAHASGDADRVMVDEHHRLAVPPEHPEYVLRRLWLSKDDEDGYYYGFANRALWPLCHIAYQRPMFDGAEWDAYRRVNRQFADAVLDEARGRPAIVLIQDYHFALLPRMLRDSVPEMLISQFWHIPWPNRETFRVCPWEAEILDGLLGNDLLGFHIRYHCNNFLETVASSIEARVSFDRWDVTRAGYTTLVRSFPISLDVEAVSEQASSPATAERVARLRRQLDLGREQVLLGVDRIDYTKGILERLRAVDRLLATHREYLGKLRFIQLAAPSRGQLPEYRALTHDIEVLVEEINARYGAKFGDKRWSPIVYHKAQHQTEEVLAYYRLADVCVCSSLHDGMNLVAKEYVAARPDGDGVLVLSRFTGAARELEHALHINPYATDQVASTLHDALSMNHTERCARMAALRETIASNNIYKWAAKIVLELGRIAARRRLET